MRQASKRIPESGEKTVRDIRRAIRRHHSAEEKIRIVLGEGFICTAYSDVVAVLPPADIDLVGRHAIKVCERALDGSAVDIDCVHFNRFQQPRCLARSFQLQSGYLEGHPPSCASLASRNRQVNYCSRCACPSV